MFEQEVKQAADKIAGLLEELTGRKWLVEGMADTCDMVFICMSGTFRRRSHVVGTEHGSPLLPEQYGPVVYHVAMLWDREQRQIRALMDSAPMSEENYRAAVERRQDHYELWLNQLQSEHDAVLQKEVQKAGVVLCEDLLALERAYREWQGGQDG